jgi:hypothetical protein
LKGKIMNKPRRGRPKGSKNKTTLKKENADIKDKKVDNTEFVDKGIRKRWWKKRATKCTEELTDAICNNLYVGMYVNEACLAEGLSPSTATSWKNKADADETNGETDSPYIAFRDAVVMAHAQAERDLMTEIRHAHTNQTNFANLAWILERTRNQRFGQRQEITQTIDARPAELPPDPPKDYDEWLERRKKRQEISNVGQEGLRTVDAKTSGEGEGKGKEMADGQGRKDEESNGEEPLHNG